MAKRRRRSVQSTSSIETNAFSKGMYKDLNESLTPKTNWTHARNAANNSVDGDVGVLGNEPANLLCAKIPYTVIGAIHKVADQWVIFSTDDVNSEIGLFDDSKCEYTTLINDKCLSFNRTYLITGAMKENFDCTWQVYFDDGNNPSRTINIDNIPYVQVEVTPPGSDCAIYEDTTDLDCEKIRLAPLLTTPCVKLTKAQDGGQLRNGSYQAYIAYVVNEQKVTDYIGVSNIQSLFEHQINGGSLDIEVSNLDKDFEFYELVILSDNQGQKVAKKIGIYSTEQTIISIDFIDQSTVSVDLVQLFLRSPAYEKSESMYVVNDWLIRQGPTEQFDFNYQPIANEIKAHWTVAEYPSTYYKNGGNKVGFLRDEQYAFFIRWIYNTGEKSASYHIPGRAPKFNGATQFDQNANINETGPAGLNSISSDELNFQVYNTATISNSNINTPTEDGEGLLLSKGEMAYWQSTEKYPATQPEIWGDLCGKYIRHHKMPSEELDSSLQLSGDAGTKIRILGVEFSNIKRPKFNDGTIIPNIVGYEILRGSREGNKSILAKGVLRNMRAYDIPNIGNQNQLLGGVTEGLYPNYPYNDLRSDIYHHDGTGDFTNFDYLPWAPDYVPRTDGCENSFTSSRINFPPLTKFKRDIFTFHSPELMFRRPFLNAAELRLYGAVSGKSEGSFKVSEKHPQNKLLRNAAVIVAGLIGIGYAIAAIRGRKNKTVRGASSNVPMFPLWALLGSTTGFNFPGFHPALAGIPAVSVSSAIIDELLETAINDAASIADLFAGGLVSDLLLTVQAGASTAKGTLPGLQGGGYDFNFQNTEDTSEVPLFVRLFTGVQLAQTNITIGAQKIIDLIYNTISFQDFAWKYNSVGELDTFHLGNGGDIFRSKVLNQDYVGSAIKGFSSGEQGVSNFKINNLYRPDTIVVRTGNELPLPTNISGVIDRSRFTVGGDSEFDFGNSYIQSPESLQVRDISMNYGALKFNFENQYGQLRNIKQTPMNGCVYDVDPLAPGEVLYQTTPIFSGDTFIGKYSEKVIMPIFNDFLLGQPDQYPYNYLQRVNIPYPRFWMDTRQYDVSNLVNMLTSFGLGDSEETPLPNDLFYLDRGSNTCAAGFSSLLGSKGGNSLFAMRYGFMYTHVNGILNFPVESEINLAYRDWDDDPAKRYYDEERYTNVDDLFNSEIIRKDNFYKYDFSLSTSRFLTNLTTNGSIQPTDYDPIVAEKCYSYYPKRLIYSLQAQLESKRDFWRVYLTNNYRDFKNEVNIIKPINKSGAIIFFPYQSPQMFQGVDSLTTTDAGTKITIGDGGLFSQPFQNLVNSDLSNEYGSCESQRGVINTPYGFFFISQAQGKVFQQSGQSISPISNQGMKWWFNKYLPSRLIRQFPELESDELGDNPVIGVGCQVIYDISDDVVYFCKKDFQLREEFVDNVEFRPEDGFYTLGQVGGNEVESKLLGGIKLTIGDPRYFEDCSWTVSYDPKAKAWISFHDWHPELLLPSVNHFLTTKTTESEEPYCPPGSVYNPATRRCESTQRETQLAVVTPLELPTTIIEGECNCPPGYTLVYPNDDNGYTLPEGACKEDNPPICRKIVCNCPPSGLPGATVVQSGECDDVYLAGPNGDPNYVNFNPLRCNYIAQISEAPNYITGGIWRHNYRCDLYSNYYGVDYPWEIEFTEATGQMVNTLRSVEYQLESYVYKGDLFNGCGDDRWHDLDFNFDEAIIYNTEQVSGLLRLDLDPKEDPINALTYPIINANDIQILYSKEEQKYRFNQFFDATNDRGEFTNSEQQIFITELNGYIRDLNAINIDYQKSETQRKKFRHYYNKLILRRRQSNNRKMLLKLNNAKLNLSYR
jgi:hypothetical protein